MTDSGGQPSLGQRLDAALKAGNWQQALGLLQTWTTQKPTEANGWYWTAYCLEQLGKRHSARIALKKAASLNPDDDRLQRLLNKINQSAEKIHSTKEDSGEAEVPPTEIDLEGDAPPTETGHSGAIPSTDASDTTLWEVGRVIDGRYEVRDVRRGGMGEVYFVFDRALALDLAVKTPLPKTLATASGRLRFLREAEAWIGLGLHVNICAAYFVRELGGIARLFIELIDGDGMDQWIKGEHSQAQRLDMAIQIASGMHHAHTFEWIDDTGIHHNGLAHRDLKPANVLIGSDGIAKVTDFGLVGRGFIQDEPIIGGDDEIQTSSIPADGIWKTMTLGGGLMGTPPYMPPEQWDGGHAAGKPADIYAFGCILFELFCGRRPFVLPIKDQKALPEVQLALIEEMHRNSPPPAPQSLNPTIDDDLSDLMLQCLEKEASHRPSSFSDIRQRLVDIFTTVSNLPYPRPNPKARLLLGDALNNQAVSYATLGQLSRAEHAWEDALARDPRHIEASFNLALFRWQSRGAGDAETLARMEEVLRGDTPPWKAQHLAGKLFLMVGNRAKALESLRTAYRDSNGMPEVARDFAVALCSRSGSSRHSADFNEAIGVLSRCGGPLRFDPLLLTTYALAVWHSGKEATSAGLYREARRHDPSLPVDLEDGTRRLIPGTGILRDLKGFSGRVLQLAMEPTGRRAVSVLHDGSICIWDMTEGEIEHMVRPRGGRPRCLALSPDATHVLTSVEGNPVTVMDADNTLSEWRLQPHAGFLNALKLTDDGRRVVGVGTTGKVNVWDLEERSLIGAFTVHNGFLTDLALAGDCKTVLVGGSGGRSLLVDLDDGEILARLDRHKDQVTAVAISPGGRVALSGDENGEIRVWDLPEGSQRLSLQGHQGTIRYLAVDRTASTGLSTDSTGALRLWDLESGQLLTSVQLGNEAHCGAATPNWSTVLIAHGPTGLTHFDFTTVPRPMLTWAIASPVTVSEAEDRARQFSAHMLKARTLLGEGAAAAAIQEIDTARAIPGYGRMEEALDLAAEAGSAYPRAGLKAAWSEDVFTIHHGRVNSARVSPRGDVVISVGSDRQVLRWALADGTIQGALEGIEAPELSAVFLSGGDRCITGGMDNVVRIWNCGDGNCLQTFEGHLAQINDIATAGDLILSGSSDETVRVWDPQTGVCLQVFDGHSGEILAVAFSPDASLCASSGEDELLLWNPLSGQDIVALTGHDQAVSSIIWSDDGRNLLTAGEDGQLRLWDVTTAYCLRTIEIGHAVQSLALSPDGRFALTGGLEGTMRLWDIRNRECLRSFEGHIGSILSVEFTPNGRRCVSAGDDGTIRTWYLEWSIGQEVPTDWNEQARPYLEVFLTRHTKGSARPRWKTEDFEALLQDLERRRLGRLDPDEVREKLEAMAAQRMDPELNTIAITRLPRRQGPASASRRKAAREKLIRRIGIGSATAALIVIVGWILSAGRLDINPRRAADIHRLAFEARVPYGITTGPLPDCSPRRFREYLDTFTKGLDEPYEIDAAAECLAQLKDGRAVAPLLDLFRPRVLEDGRIFNPRLSGVSSDVLSILVAIGDEGCPGLKEGLVDELPSVRHTAATALAAMGSERAISTLVESAGDPEPVVRIAVSETLEFIAASEVIDEGEAFELFRKMSRDTYPEIRINVARELEVFTGSRPRKLLEDLTQDIDRQVAQEAQIALARFDRD